MVFGKALIITLLSFFLFQGNLSANDDFDLLSNFQVSKDDISKSLDNLRQMGKISEEDYQKAKKELSGMSNNQVSALKETAVGLVRNDPDKAVGLVKKGSAINPEEVRKQIGDLSIPKE